MSEILEFIQSKEYNKLIDKVLEVVVIEIDNEVPEVLLNYHKRDIEKAGINVNDLTSFLNQESNDKLPLFIKEVLLRDASNDIDEEYPRGQEPEDYDEPVTIATSPDYYKSFAILIILEYYFLKNDPNNLEKFLKSIRITGAKQFAKELKEIYNKL